MSTSLRKADRRCSSIPPQGWSHPSSIGNLEGEMQGHGWTDSW